MEQPKSPFSRRSVRLFAAAIAGLLVLGGLVGALGRGGGAHPKSASNVKNTGTPTDTTLPLGKVIPATLASLMGLTPLHRRAAPGFALVDQHGHRVSLSRVRGDAVLLTFLDAGCSGICPVESAELRAAERDLGAKSASVDVLVVNLDGSHRTVAAMGHLAQLTGLDPLGTFHTLTGTMTTLRTIWKAYGVQVQVDEVTGTVLYEPLILFIDPSGHERYRAVPTGFELPSGRYVAPAAQITEFAQGIAHFAAALLPGSS